MQHAKRKEWVLSQRKEAKAVDEPLDLLIVVAFWPKSHYWEQDMDGWASNNMNSRLIVGGYL